MGFMVVGNSIPYFHIYYHDLNLSNIKEVDDLEIISKEIRNCILDDLLEAIENDMCEGNKSNPEKWVKEIFKEGLL